MRDHQGAFVSISAVNAQRKDRLAAGYDTMDTDLIQLWHLSLNQEALNAFFYNKVHAFWHFGPCVKIWTKTHFLLAPERPLVSPSLSVYVVLASFVYEFFNLCGSVHRLFSGEHGRSSPDHAVDRRRESRPLGTRWHGTAAATWTRWDGRGRKETRHRWHSASDHDHNWSEPGRGTSKVGWFIYFIKLEPLTLETLNLTPPCRIRVGCLCGTNVLMWWCLSQSSHSGHSFLFCVHGV